MILSHLEWHSNICSDWNMAVAEKACLGALQNNDNDDSHQYRVGLEWCLEQAGPPGIAVTVNWAKIWAYGSEVKKKRDAITVTERERERDLSA